MSKDMVDAEAVTGLKGFYFRISPRIKGTKAGIHKSPYKGISPDFLEYKEYSQGDELKHIDWRLYGRLDRLYVKKFEDEVNVKWYILLDRSESMNYGPNGRTKHDYAVSLSATLTYLLLQQGDAVGIADFYDNNINIILPKAGTKNINQVLERLARIKPAGKTNLKEPILRAVEKSGGDAVLIVVSDFLTDLNSVEESFKFLRAYGKEAIAFHVLDQTEIDFNFDGSIEFEDMEDKTKVLIETEDIKNAYRKRISDFIHKLKSICLDNGSRYVLSPTNTPIKDTLVQIAER
ncbi:MAG TPA: DUF58 domain-containing protein [Thermodesulfobacteriota bacterium]|nr:DUF58 domain-containing protein [Thermodesulfobacteriota bacterium]